MRNALFGRSNFCVRILLCVTLTIVGRLLAGLALASALAVHAEAEPVPAVSASARSSETYRPAKAMEGWTLFCVRYAEECAVDITEPETIELTERVWTLITSTNRNVNRRIKPVTDQQHWGVVDRWDLPNDGKGDCEDYQLLKRKLLVKSGLPRRAMRMAVVIDEEGQGHAVLLVRTSKGDFVLDNKRDNVLTWEQTPYMYIKRESQAGLGWVSLGRVTSPTATANR